MEEERLKEIKEEKILGGRVRVHIPTGHICLLDVVMLVTRGRLKAWIPPPWIEKRGGKRRLVALVPDLDDRDRPILGARQLWFLPAKVVMEVIEEMDELAQEAQAAEVSKALGMEGHLEQRVPVKL